MNTNNSLIRGLEDCTFEFDVAHDNLQTFHLFDNQIDIAFEDEMNAKTRRAYWVYMNCENFLYRHELNEDGKTVKYPTQEAYLAEVDRRTGRGVSTLKRDNTSIRIAKAQGLTVTDLAMIGIEELARICPAFKTDTGYNVTGLKSGPIPEKKDPVGYFHECIETLTAGKEHLLDKDLSTGKIDKWAIEHRMLRPGTPRIWIEDNEHGTFWFYERYVEAMLQYHTGEILIEYNGTKETNVIEIKITGKVIPPEVEDYFIGKKLGIQRSSNG